MVLTPVGGCRAVTGPTTAVVVVLLLQLRHNGLSVHLRLPLAQPSVLAADGWYGDWCLAW